MFDKMSDNYGHNIMEGKLYFREIVSPASQVEKNIK